MKQILKYLLLTCGFTIMIINTGSAGLSNQKPIEVKLELSEYKFTPSNLKFESGKLYKMVITNKGKEKHEIDSASISHLAYTRKVEALDKQGKVVAEVKGNPAEIEVMAGYTVNWWFVPNGSTDGPQEFICALPGHMEAGMVGKIEFD